MVTGSPGPAHDAGHLDAAVLRRDDPDRRGEDRRRRRLPPRAAVLVPRAALIATLNRARLASRLGEPLGVPAGLVVAQHRRDRGQQLVRIDRLDQVGVGAALQTLGAVDRVDRRRRHMDHRDGAVHRVGLDPLADIEAAHVGQADVEHDQSTPPRPDVPAPRPRSTPRRRGTRAGAASSPARTAWRACRRRPARPLRPIVMRAPAAAAMVRSGDDIEALVGRPPQPAGARVNVLPSHRLARRQSRIAAAEELSASRRA